jgi:hypothetical protein
MLHRNSSATGWGLAVLLTASVFGQAHRVALMPGDSLPPLAGRTVSGNQLSLPSAAVGAPAVVIFSFSRAGGSDARDWAQRLARDYPHLAIYTAIFLESVPRFFRPLAASNIRNGMPVSMHDRTMLLYQDQKTWEEALNVTNESCAVVVLLGPDGHVRWIASGPFTDSLYLRLKEEMERISKG